MASMHAARKTRLSASEERLLALLSRRPRDTGNLTEAFYHGDPDAPTHARRVISYLIRSLEDKLDAAGSAIRLRRTSRAGKHPARVWLEKK